jgi:diaminopimelate epimerase
MTYDFLKGHGTENDFVLLPDHDGSVHGGLSEEQWVRRVAALCDRRAGLGADGVLRVVRTSEIAAGDGQAAEWFMDYRNSDGSLSEMCGNGVRVFARYLLQEGLVEDGVPIPVGTRGGVKTVVVEGELLSVTMGPAALLGPTSVVVDGSTWPATHVDMGNPHAVVVVQDLAQAGLLYDEPTYDHTVFPQGVNVEFVLDRGDGRLEMRVHERGSGETRSCGTGACAVGAAVAVAAGGNGRRASYDIGVPGGRLRVDWRDDDEMVLTGPAIVVARGTTSL